MRGGQTDTSYPRSITGPDPTAGRRASHLSRWPEYHPWALGARAPRLSVAPCHHLDRESVFLPGTPKEKPGASPILTRVAGPWQLVWTPAHRPPTSQACTEVLRGVSGAVGAASLALTRGLLALAARAWTLVMGSTPCLREDPILLHLAIEPLEGSIEIVA